MLSINTNASARVPDALDADGESSELAALASFDLPASPVRSPVGSESNMSVWVEATTDGEQRVHVALADASVPSLPSLPSSPSSPSSSLEAAAGGAAASSSQAFDASASTGALLDFPLVLCDSTRSGADRHSAAASASSAIVPFQKLQMDTNLNETLLPYKQQTTAPPSPPTAAASASASSPQTSVSPGASAAPSSASTSSPSARAKKKTSAAALAWDAETSAIMSSEFMHALRLSGGDLRPQEPQLSVRLRGRRVELASAADDEDVDFIGPAENIKKLFKLPYSQARVSLAVHRVGSTLVVDGELQDSDLPAGFADDDHDGSASHETVRTLEQAQEQSQSLLYEKFLYESAVQGRQLTATDSGESASAAHQQLLPVATHEPAPPSVTAKSKSKKKSAKKAKKRAMASALASSGDAPVALDAPTSWMAMMETSAQAHSDASASSRHATTAAKHKQSKKGGTARADGSDSASPPYSSPSSDRRGEAAYTQAFQRVLKWKFHDLKMILGSQVLLFSNKEHPAVSLKLHDMDTDLSLCTVLDYYLDNVIANIPELAICMHSKGLVRGYKLVETRQIPYMSGTGRPLFDIHDVSLNASMLLKFLQENCSRPNGTYWLYRKAGESSLRLYDVNVLSQGKQLKWKYMMAMLCYRFASRASRLVHSLARDAPSLQQQLQQRQRELLSTCMALLREISQAGGAAHSSICASVSEQLADTYLRECEHVKNSSSSSDSLDDAAPLDAMVASLEKAREYLLESIRSFEECMVPLDLAATSSLPNREADRDDREETPHSPSHVSATDLQEDTGDGDSGDDGMDSFMDDERARLQLKCSSVCVQLGHVHARRRNWRDAIASVVRAVAFLPLRAIPTDVSPFATTVDKHEAIRSLLERLDFDGISGARLDAGGILICLTGSELRCRVLELVGDIAAQLPTDVTPILQHLYRVIGGEARERLSEIADPAQWQQWLDACGCAPQAAADSRAPAAGAAAEELLTLSFNAYLRALSPCVDSELYFLLMKKLGNASNELGKFFLGRRRDCAEAFRWFERGCKIFSEIEDGINVALLCANLAHLHKILAQSESTASARQSHYEAAIQLCRDALQQLKTNRADAELHRTVKGELALTYLVWAVNMATAHVDAQRDASAPVVLDVRKQRENAVLKTFNKALSLYLELDDAKQVAATHYQMASFHARSIVQDVQTQQHETPPYSSESVSASSSSSSGHDLSPLSSSSSSSSPLTGTALKTRMEIARRHYAKALAYFGKVDVGQTFVVIHQELADLYALGGRFEDLEHALLLLLTTYDAFERTTERDTGALAALATDVVAKVKLLLHQLIRMSSSTSASASSSAKRKKLGMFKAMYKEAIYYDGHNANGSIVPMLGTLRSMYLL